MAGTVFYNKSLSHNVISNREILLIRVNNCIINGYYIEAMIILHSMMENLTYYVLDKLSIPYKASDRIYQCIEYLQWQLAFENFSDRFSNNTKVEMDYDLKCKLFYSLIKSNVLDRIGEWRTKRNMIVHDIAITSYEEKELQSLAEQGVDLYCEYERGVSGVVQIESDL